MAKNAVVEIEDIKIGKGHNSKNRDPEFVKDKIIQLDADLTPLEEEAKVIREKMKALRRDFKKETGVVQADFNAGRRLARMQDQDEQREKCWNLEMSFNALSGGRQMNWLDAIEKEDKKKSDDKAA